MAEFANMSESQGFVDKWRIQGLEQAAVGLIPSPPPPFTPMATSPLEHELLAEMLEQAAPGFTTSSPPSPPASTSSGCTKNISTGTRRGAAATFHCQIARSSQDSCSTTSRVEHRRSSLLPILSCCLCVKLFLSGTNARSWVFSLVLAAENEVMEKADLGEVDTDLDPLAGNKELMMKTLMKRVCFKKKRKKKIPKEARQQLLDWWSQHQDHPYPNVSFFQCVLSIPLLIFFDILLRCAGQGDEKSNLAQSTGLEPKQINNWFINQRKRHWPQAARGESSQQRHSKSRKLSTTKKK
ncbi:uncharacterized protein LOC112348098 [Selaginella moellendorffii]|uniref:uncharacterized protein LOC112348098 n=1 Tax=Selaginella moellendorffii TaxID=88036 RepID=UPI000D1CE9C0|nr:uncharacterized protein LOC112348098 [Selaginella moellendorffii]|eukprot:XP_024535927.1 uncharacterized protein LOC112348098 [Selaginella moellendorffii]